MHISKIELENIKSHAAATYEFTRGTTAITGENGAGKTTIIEAVAWTLFDLLEYKKEDFVRRGEKKGVVKITFESGLDEREYIVYRDTGAGYHVTDPRLNTRIADKKEEVFRFLWQHLGLEPGTDLKSLFRQAIGVPQCIAVVDPGGNLLAFVRMDGAKVLSQISATQKAITAASSRAPTGGAPDDLALKLALATEGRVTNLKGGLPIMVDGHCLGAIGVGSGTGEQDKEVAKAALGAIAGTKRF